MTAAPATPPAKYDEEEDEIPLSCTLAERAFDLPHDINGSVGALVTYVLRGYDPASRLQEGQRAAKLLALCHAFSTGRPSFLPAVQYVVSLLVYTTLLNETASRPELDELNAALQPLRGRWRPTADREERVRAAANLYRYLKRTPRDELPDRSARLLRCLASTGASDWWHLNIAREGFLYLDDEPNVANRSARLQHALATGTELLLH